MGNAGFVSSTVVFGIWVAEMSPGDDGFFRARFPDGTVRERSRAIAITRFRAGFRV